MKNFKFNPNLSDKKNAEIALENAKENERKNPIPAKENEKKNPIPANDPILNAMNADQIKEEILERRSLHFIPNRMELSKDDLKKIRGKRRALRDKYSFQISFAYANGKIDDAKGYAKLMIDFLILNYPDCIKAINSGKEIDFLSCISNKLWKSDIELKSEEINQKKHLQKSFDFLCKMNAGEFELKA